MTASVRIGARARARLAIGARWPALMGLVLMVIGGFPRVPGADTGTGGQRIILSQGRPPAEPDSHRAVIHLVREQFIRAYPLSDETIFLDGVPGGLLPQRGWFTLDVVPGWHTVSGIINCADLRIECRAGHSYLIRLREAIDESDHLRADLLLEDPPVLEGLIRRGRLRHAETTESGFRHLRGQLRSRRISVPAGAAEPGHATTFDFMLCEKPLDLVSYQSDFSILAGRLTLHDTGLRYHLRDRLMTSLASWKVVGDSLEIAAEDIVRVRFGGTRVTGANPWVSVDVLSPSGIHTISFADQRQDEGVATYNRLFMAIQALVRSRPPAAEAEP